MDLELLQMAIKSLAVDLAETKNELKVVRTELNDLRRRPAPIQTEQKTVAQDDEPLTLLEARRMLKVCRNVFLKMVQNGIFKQIRMNARTIRYSKFAIQDFISRNSSQHHLREESNDRKLRWTFSEISSGRLFNKEAIPRSIDCMSIGLTGLPATIINGPSVSVNNLSKGISRMIF